MEYGSLDGHAAVGRLDARLGIGATPAPIRERSLRVGVDHAHTLANVHRRNGEPNGKCAFAATTLLSCQDDDLHLASPFNGKSRDLEMILQCETNTFAASTRVKAIRPVLHFCCLESFGNDFAPDSAGFK